ncbi:MAG: acyl carrier protein [bacterium]|nr:acyl carrier protein [bacterium]
MDEILEGVRKAFADAFETPPEKVTLEAEPDDIEGWDSLGHVELVGKLEEVFGVSFEVDDIMEMETVAAIQRIVGTYKK